MLLRCLIPRPPNVPLLRALWSLLVGIWGILKGSWGVLVEVSDVIAAVEPEHYPFLGDPAVGLRTGALPQTVQVSISNMHRPQSKDPLRAQVDTIWYMDPLGLRSSVGNRNPT